MNFTIVGAGISGLTAAYYLKKIFNHEINVTIIEKNSRIGGWIRTDRISQFLFERGPRSLRAKGNGGAALNLIEEAGLSSEIIQSSPSAKNRFVWHAGQLHQAPVGLWQLLRSSLTKDLIFSIIREGFRPLKQNDDESIYSFISRRYSPEIAERLIDPLTACIYGGDIHTLSMKSCFPLLKEWEEKHGSILKGAIKQLFRPSNSSHPKGLISLRNGIESLPIALFNLLNADCHFNTEIVKIRSSSSSIDIELSTGIKFKTDYLIWAAPLDPLTELLQVPTLNIPSASLVVVNTGWNKSAFPREGFGCVFPSRANTPLLGIVWDSSAFPQQNNDKEQTRLTLMLGGAHDPSFIHQSEAFMHESTAKHLKQFLNIETSPDVLSIFKAHQAIPLYPVFHHQQINNLSQFLENSHPRIRITGAAVGGVAVGSCIFHARETVLSFGGFAKN